MLNIPRTGPRSGAAALLLTGLATAALTLGLACGGGAEAPESGATPGGRGETPVVEFNAFDFLSAGLPGFGEGLADYPIISGRDRSLAGVIVRPTDLPPAFSGPGGSQFFLVINSEEGPAEIAVSTYFSGGTADEEGSFAGVLSAATNLAPELVDEALDDFPSGDDAFDRVSGAIEDLEPATTVELLDAQPIEVVGVGDEAKALRLDIDFGQVLGALVDDEDASGRLAVEMYVFKRQDHLLLLMVIWPAEQDPPVDVVGLAQVVDERSLEAF